MSPDNSPNERRVIILPLPVWLVWAVGVAVYSGAALITRVISTGWGRCRTARTPQLAAQHQDRQCRQLAQRLFDHLNAYRAEEGLRTLRWSQRLEASSLYQCTRMSELGEFAHVLSDGVELSDRVERFGYRYRSCGENLYWLLDPTKGTDALAWVMHDGWVHSPGHQQNLVGDWTDAGIGVVRDGEGGFYATQNFGRPASPW